MAAVIQGRGQVVKGDVFIFPKGEKLDESDLQGFMSYQRQLEAKHYRKNYRFYTGEHSILTRESRVLGPDARLVVGMPKLLVDEYSGYFGGIQPTPKLEEKELLDRFQDWLKHVDFGDEHSEVVKSVAIYGRGYLFMYQDESGTPNLAHVEPDEGFMVYDDTIKTQPLAFVHYMHDKEGHDYGEIYYPNEVVPFYGDKLQEPQSSVFHDVPAREFYANEERQGIFDGVKTLIDELDEAISQKANQVAYFDDAYLLMLGLRFVDKDGNPITPKIDRNQRLIYIPDADATTARVEFLQKPDADQIQENLLDRLVNLIYDTAAIPNLQDEAFSGNSSGVALQFKLLPMQNMASFQERKFKKSLYQLMGVLFQSADGGQVVTKAKSGVWQQLDWSYSRNMPTDIAGAVQTAVNAQGLLPLSTRISWIPGIDDPQAEIDKMAQEKQDALKQSMQLSPSATDFQKLMGGDDDGEEDSEDPEE